LAKAPEITRPTTRQITSCSQWHSIVRVGSFQTGLPPERGGERHTRISTSRFFEDRDYRGFTDSCPTLLVRGYLTPSGSTALALLPGARLLCVIYLVGTVVHGASMPMQNCRCSSSSPTCGSPATHGRLKGWRGSGVIGSQMEILSVRHMSKLPPSRTGRGFDATLQPFWAPDTTTFAEAGTFDW
jgi:hypothetical protein